MTQELRHLIISSIFATTGLFLFISIFVFALLIKSQRRKRKHDREILELRELFNNELMQSQLEIQEQTFRIISQEIHDNIGQVLTLVKLNMNIVPAEFAHLPMIADSRELLTKAISDLRNLSKALSPERIAEIDLAESIRHELQMLAKTKIYTTSLQSIGAVYTIKKENKIILFRIFQEVLNNIIKHAGATTIDVELQYDEEQFGLIATDNGKGFNVNEAVHGIGLRNIKNRSGLIGAFFEIISAAGKGTKIAIYLPVTKD